VHIFWGENIIELEFKMFDNVSSKCVTTMTTLKEIFLILREVKFDSDLMKK
jgi:hypothetical protein